jgi:predicted dehydrogenase
MSLSGHRFTQLEAAATFSLSFQLTIDRLLFTVRRAWLLKSCAAGEPSLLSNSGFLKQLLFMQTEKPLQVGIVGAGVISAAYLKTKFPQFKVTCCSDIQPTQAEMRAREFRIGAVSTETILADPTIDIVLNLTTPQYHAAVTGASLRARKHVYSEKPLSISTGEAEPLLSEAAANRLRIGCAPDTFLGGAQQTGRKLLDEGAIGSPIGGTVFFMSGGPESWHPNPEFFYQKGAGPVFDMGPYYLTALVNLLGPIKRVWSAGRTTLPQRTIGSGPRKGAAFPVSVLSYVSAILELKSGPIITFVASFDVPAYNHPYIEIYGTGGTLQLPDPNYFGGSVRLNQNGQWVDVSHSHGFGDGNYRGIGLADLVAGLRSGTPHRASAELAFHVLEVMEAIVETAGSGQAYPVRSSCERPRALRPVSHVPDFS